MVGDKYRERLKILIEKIEIICYLEQMLEDDDEKDFANRLFFELETQDMTLDDLVLFRIPFAERRQSELIGRTTELERMRTAGPHQSLWWVSNKTGSTVGVMATGKNHAAELAYRFGFVREEKNAKVRKASDSDVQRLTRDGSAFGRAVRSGVPGVIEQKGRNVVVGDHVFTPISLVT